MTRPSAIFYHCLLYADQPLRFLPRAAAVVAEQLSQLQGSGLLKAAAEFHVGINGGQESTPAAKRMFPPNASLTFHGLSSRAENPTILLLEDWVKTHPGWNVLYAHSKGASKIKPADIAHADNWRWCMMRDLVTKWRDCVSLLPAYDIVCSHWKWGCIDGTQHIPAGNFLWVTSDFAAKLPSILLRDRIIKDGIGAASSRYEAEVYWGNGPRPRVYQFRPDGAGML